MRIFCGEWNKKVEQHSTFLRSVQAVLCIIQSNYTNFRNTLPCAEHPPRGNSLGDLESEGFFAYGRISTLNKQQYKKEKEKKSKNRFPYYLGFFMSNCRKSLRFAP